MRPRLPCFVLVTLVAAGTVLAGSPAYAGTEGPHQPWSQPTDAPGTTAASPVAPAPASPGTSEQTHAFFLPTGNVLRGGQMAVRSQALFAYNQVAFGLTDHVELDIGAPILPFVVTAGIRAQLMPRGSSVRLLVSGGVWLPLVTDERYVAFSGAATLAYQSRAINLHVTLGAMQQKGTGDFIGDSSIALTSAGALLGGGRNAFFVEVGHLRAVSPEEVLPGGIMGVKLMRGRFDIDLGVLGGIVDAPSIYLLPFIATTRRF